ncbi:hypothetical protein ACKFKH_27350, partial [Phormidesmis sp. 146-20]
RSATLLRYKGAEAKLNEATRTCVYTADSLEAGQQRSKAASDTFQTSSQNWGELEINEAREDPLRVTQTSRLKNL